jgi:hypothetical protein
MAVAAARFPGGPGLNPTAAKGWPGAPVAGRFEAADALDFPVKLGSLYWPTGASRFAVGYFLVTLAQLNSIRGVVGDSASQPGVAATLQILPNSNSASSVALVSTSLYMLPARPLLIGPGGAATLYVLTLVDDRYWLRYKPAGERFAADDGSTLWGDLLTNFGTDLGGTWTFDSTASGTWGKPPKGLDLRRVSASFALDAVAYAVGQRVRRKLDGTYKGCSPATAATELAANTSAPWFKNDNLMGGGAAVPTGDKAAALPEKVQVAFTRTGSAATHVIAKTLVSLDGTLDPSHKNAIKSWKADWRVDPGDSTEMTLRDSQVSALGAAWGKWQLAAPNYSLAGIQPWAPEASCDHVEWHLSESQCYTAVRRPPFDDGVTELIGLPAATPPATGGDVEVIVKDSGTAAADLRGTAKHLKYDADKPNPEWDGDDFQTTNKTSIWLMDRRRAALAPGDREECHQVGTFDPRNPIQPGTVTGATNASPIVVTTGAAHTLSTGDTVTNSGVLGNTAANGTFVITVTDSTHFSLNGSTGSGAYTSGGTWLYVDTGKSSDSRQLYVCRDPGLHILKVTSDNPTDNTSGSVITHYWTCQRMYNDTSDHTWKTRTGDLWVKDFNNNPHALKNGYFVLAHLTDEIAIGGVGPAKKAVYTALVSCFQLDKLFKCISNGLFARGGGVIDAGGVLHVRGQDGNDFSDITCDSSFF